MLSGLTRSSCLRSTIVVCLSQLIPVLSLTGNYDGDQPGTLEFYHQHLKHAGDQANHFLVIGPWDHAGVRNPKEEFQGLKPTVSHAL